MLSTLNDEILFDLWEKRYEVKSTHKIERIGTCQKKKKIISELTTLTKTIVRIIVKNQQSPIIKVLSYVHHNKEEDERIKKSSYMWDKKMSEHGEIQKVPSNSS
jgi:hypothetical protein